jgi:hypothetical protein
VSDSPAVSIHLNLTSNAAITQHGVRLALAQQDAADLEKEDAAPVHDDVTPAMLIAAGLELEAQQ